MQIRSTVGLLALSLVDNVQLNSVSWGISDPISQRPVPLGQPSHNCSGWKIRAPVAP